ncbi:hypothetical protein N9M16_06945 [Candidatus Dependentiae bacterium]|nr:hypothetical protein [Candidatus Dependentiae bacterium]
MHAERFFTPCSQGPFVGGALFRFVPFVFNSSLRFSSTSAPSMFGTAIVTFGRHIVVIPLMRPVEWNARERRNSAPACQSSFKYFI